MGAPWQPNGWTTTPFWTRWSRGSNSVMRASCEIQEMHKFKHAPLLDKHFHCDSKMVPLFAPSKGSLSGTCFSQSKVRVGVPPHAGWWLQLMASNKRQWRAPSWLDNDSGSTSQTHSSSRMSSDDRSWDHSASPQPQPYWQHRSSSPPSMSMSIDGRLRSWKMSVASSPTMAPSGLCHCAWSGALHSIKIASSSFQTARPFHLFLFIVPPLHLPHHTAVPYHNLCERQSKCYEFERSLNILLEVFSYPSSPVSELYSLENFLRKCRYYATDIQSTSNLH